MTTFLSLLNALLPIGYLAALFGYLAVFVGREGGVSRMTGPLTWALVTLHGLYLVLAAVHYGHVPVASTWESLTFVAWALMLVYLFLEWRLKDRSTGVFLLGVVVVFQTLSSAFVTHTRDVNDVLKSPMFGVHVTAALLGYVALAVSAIYGVMYLLQYRQLKKRHVGLLFQRLPNLETLSRLNVSALGLGWLALTVAILAGTAWAVRLNLRGELEGPFATDPKFLLTLGVWALYGLCLGGRYMLKWANRTLATVSVIGFLLMLASSMMVTLAFRTFHDFS